MRDLAKALPIETANESNARKVLARAAKGLLDAKIPSLAAYRFEKSVTGKWLVVFERKHAPKQNDTYRRDAEELTPVLFGVERIVEARQRRRPRLVDPMRQASRQRGRRPRTGVTQGSQSNANHPQPRRPAHATLPENRRRVRGGAKLIEGEWKSDLAQR